MAYRKKNNPNRRYAPPKCFSSTPTAQELERECNLVADEAFRFCLLRNQAERLGDTEAYTELAVIAETLVKRSSALYEEWRVAAGFSSAPVPKVGFSP